MVFGDGSDGLLCRLDHFLEICHRSRPAVPVPKLNFKVVQTSSPVGMVFKDSSDSLWGPLDRCRQIVHADYSGAPLQVNTQYMLAEALISVYGKRHTCLFSYQL